MAACLASKGNNLTPTTSPALTFSLSLFSFVPNNAAFSQKPFKWREYTLKINNIPTVCVQLIATFALPKSKLARLSPYYSPEEWLNVELRSTVYSNNGNTKENNGRQRRSNSLRKTQQRKKGGVQTKPHLHPDRHKKKKHKAWMRTNMVSIVSGGGYMRLCLYFANHRLNNNCSRSLRYTQISFTFLNMSGDTLASMWLNKPLTFCQLISLRLLWSQAIQLLNFSTACDSV